MLGIGNSLVYPSVLGGFENNYSLSLDGTGDYLDLKNHFRSIHQGSFTWSCWVKADDGRPSAAQTIIGGGVFRFTEAFSLSIQTTGKILMLFAADGEIVQYETDSAQFANGASDWKHIACRVIKNTSANTTYSIFVNGSEVATSNAGGGGEMTDSNHAAHANDKYIYVGGWNNNDSLANPFKGKIDEVALWSTDLSGANIAKVYNSGVPFDLTTNQGNYTGKGELEAYFRMEEGSGSTVENTMASGEAADMQGDAAFSTDVPE